MKSNKKYFIIAITSITLVIYVIALVIISKNQNPYHVIMTPEQNKYEVAKAEVEQNIYTIPITIKNKANRELSSTKNFYMSYHLYDKNKKLITFDNRRTEIPTIFSTDKKIVDLQVEMPVKKGTYFLELDMVNEGVAWFSEQGNETEMVELVIK